MKRKGRLRLFRKLRRRYMSSPVARNCAHMALSSSIFQDAEYVARHGSFRLPTDPILAQVSVSPSASNEAGWGSDREAIEARENSQNIFFLCGKHAREMMLYIHTHEPREISQGGGWAVSLSNIGH